LAVSAVYPYLAVDRFLETIAGVQALTSAFELGLIDRLAAGGAVARADLASHLSVEDAGLEVLLGLLAGAGVVSIGPAGAVRLTDEFSAALDYRELLEAKLDLLRVAVPDFILGLADLVADHRRFMARSRMFQLFDYQRATTLTPENRAWTERWVRMTTALTAHEAAALLERHDFSRDAQLLDVGGNSGEFAIRICAAYPQLHATVLDLPVVCRIGEEHVQRTAEGARIRFVAGDARRDTWPAGMDVVTFKSVLHDWPDQDAALLLDRARGALRPSGSLIIFERTRMALAEGPLPCAAIPMLLFARGFRDASWYQDRLAASGFTAIRVQHVTLDTPFMIVEATAPAGVRA
jgi:SAM-dependent methyltransferase